MTILEELNRRINEKASFVEEVLSEVERVIVGQRHPLECILMSILSGGHVLLEGVPGLAKTLMVKTFADTMDLSFKRIQFTPDLLPADIIGTQIYNQSTGEFSIKEGPVFANVILADEINRAPAKVQSALLEAMQEKQVTIGGKTLMLPSPFVVLATQNPIEQEGTYPLPEAQADRFMMKILIDYPSTEEETMILERMATSTPPGASKKIDSRSILEVRELIFQIYMDDRIKRYIVSLVDCSRHPDRYGLKDLSDYIEYGCSPRATIYLALASRTRAFLDRRGFVIPEDVKFAAREVMRHRIVLSYFAEAEGVDQEQILTRILEGVEVP